MSDIQKAFWNHEVAKYLDIGESTLRKWCIELEKNGYVFIKGAKDSRAFTNHDLEALNLFKQLTKAKKHTLHQAALVVIEKYKREEESERASPDMDINLEIDLSSAEDLKKMMKQLLENQEEQMKFNKALLEKLDQQNNFINESLKKRDQLLLENIRKSQEEKAAAIEEEKAEKKKSKFKRIINIMFKS